MMSLLYVSTVLNHRRRQICLSGFNVSLAPRYGQVLSAAEVRLWKAQEQFVNLRLVTASSLQDSLGKFKFKDASELLRIPRFQLRKRTAAFSI